MSTELADPMAELQAAVVAHRAGRLDEAEHLYRAVLAVQPDDVNALHLLGVVHRQRGQPAAAVAFITQALQHAPGLVDAHINLGNAYGDMQHFDAAADSYAAARRLGGGSADTLSGLLAALQSAAAAHRAAGRNDEARQCLQRALAEAPDRLDLMQALLQLCRDDDTLEALILAAGAWRLAADEASLNTLWDLANAAGTDVAHTREFLAADPQDPFRLLALGNALRRAGQGWEAEAVYRTAITRAPDQPFARLRLACLLLEQDRWEAADRLLREVEASDPDRVQAMQFGNVFFRRLRRCAVPPPEGFAPHPCTADLVVFTACDGGQFARFAGTLLTSVQRNAGVACQFHLHVVNPPADLPARIAAYRAMPGSPAIAVSTEWMDTGAWDADACRAGVACARFRLLPHLMEAYAAPILMLDTDLLVLRNLTGLLEAAAEGDIALIVGEPHACEPWNRLRAGVAFFNATASALACVDLIARYVDQQRPAGRVPHLLDQIALGACILAGFHGQAAPQLVALPADIQQPAPLPAEAAGVPPGDSVLFWSPPAGMADATPAAEMPFYRDYALPWPPADLPAEPAADPWMAEPGVPEAEMAAA